MKKFVPLTVSLCLIFTLFSCNKTQKNQEPSTVAQALAMDFESKVSSNAQMNCEALADYLLQNEVCSFSGMTLPVQEGFLNGFTSEVTGFSEAAMFSPMIGAIPFVAYVFQVESNQDAFIQTLKEKADLRWNVCTQADEMVAVSKGNKVFFVMAPISFEVE